MLRAVDFEVPACTAAQNSHCQNQQKRPGITFLLGLGFRLLRRFRHRSGFGSCASTLGHVDRADLAIRMDGSGRTFFRLYPEEYGPRLFELLGWEGGRGVKRFEHTAMTEGAPVLSVRDLHFPALPPMTFDIRRGEIAFLRDENYNTGRRLHECFLGDRGWTSGFFRLNGRLYQPGDLGRVIGSEIGIQIERPDRPGGVLFDNMTALDNLCTSLIPKAGQHIIRKKIVSSILSEALRWFPKEMLLQPLSNWSYPERLRFSYYRWYLLNPRLLICFFPFAGQESTHHKMIIDLLVLCAQRGMAVWIISSGIDAICEKTDNEEFLRRLHYLNK